MAQHYIVPNIYQDISNQYQGYFAFRFTCAQCSWQIDTMPIRSNVTTATNIMDIGVGLLGGFWGRAAEAGEKIYGTQWHTEQANALQKAWAEIQHNFHHCPKCHRTVCNRCFNVQLNLCTGCAPDLRADGINFQHQMNIDAQHQQIQQNYQAPQFNVNAIPSAVTPDLVNQSPQQPRLPQSGVQGQPPTPAAIAGFGTPGYPQSVMCPTCRRMGPPGKFCQDCGTKLPLPDLFCPRCASPLENSARFCPECGAKLQTAT
ncbi:MAG: zinc ribbon domain-containing protein [Chloroflexi bacterium]|nr:zinc ribbon domain-containing protein [Chloroflexota bacterium]